MPEASEQHDLGQLAEEFVSRRRQGERATIEEYAAEYPDLAEEIRDLFPTVIELEQLKVHKVFSSGGPAASIGPVPLHQLGDFRIIREIGRGGMGVVYEAEQESLHRRVALKVLGTQMGMSARQKARFRREAEVAARLHHTNIVPIYGVGEDKGLQFYAMQFIEGVPLNRLIRAWREAADGGSSDPAAPSHSTAGSLTLVGAVQEILKAEAAADADTPSGRVSATLVDGAEDLATVPSPLMQVQLQERSASSGPPRVFVQSQSEVAAGLRPPLAVPLPREHRAFWNEIVRLVIDVALGLEHAHHLGILHRDVKPANLLLDLTGSIWITDFGLAKMETQDHTITRSGDFIGTLRYVSPEQLHGQADPRSDVYSLGLTLFELLTLQPAFADEPLGEIMKRQTRELPRKPRAINPLIPRDLETITLKACAADPAHRYQSAAEFAADLRRFVDDRPIRARPITWAERFWRWSRKNPVIAGLGTVSALLLVSLIGVLGVANYKISQGADSLKQSADLLKIESGLAKQSAIEAQASALDAQTERELANANLKLALQAFEDIMDNLSARGSPVSLVSEEDTPSIAETVEASPADAVLLERLLEFFNLFAKQNQTDLTAEMAAIRSRIGDIQLRLGRATEAEASYTESAKTYDTVRASHSTSIPLLLAHAKTWNHLGVAYSQHGQVMEAFGSHHEACRLLEETQADREALEVQLELAQSLILADTVFIRSGASEVMSEMFRDMGNRPPPPPGSYGPQRRPAEGNRDNPDRSRRGDDRDRPNRERPAGDRPDRERADRGRDRGMERGTERGPGPAWQRPRDDWDKGSIKAVALLEKLWAAHPSHPQVRLLLARAYRNRYYANRRRHIETQANLDLQTAIDHLTALGDSDPTSPTYRFELADLLCLPLASSTPQAHDAETIKRLEQSIALSEKLLHDSPTIPEYQALLGMALRRLASLQQSAHQLDQAEAGYLRAIEIQRPLAARYPSTSIHQVAYVKSLAGLADLDKVQGQIAEATAGLDRAIAVLKEFLTRNGEDRLLKSLQDQLQKRRDKLQAPPSAAPQPAPAT